MMFKQRLFTVLLGVLFAVALTDQASALYDPGVGRFCSRDPIGYVDGANSYSFLGLNPVLNVDASGYAKCKLRTIPDLENQVEQCSEFEWGRGNLVIGFFMKIRLEFVGPKECCNCCSYRQFLLLKNVKIEYDDGHGVWVQLEESNFPEELHSYGGPGREDCGPVGNVILCYGHRGKDHKGSVYENDGCSFRMIDTPNIKIEALGLILRARVPNLLPRRFKISIFRRFLISVIDTCDNNNVVWSEIVDRSCDNYIYTFN